MKNITLTKEELNEYLQAMQQEQAMQAKSEFSMQLMKDSYTLNIIAKDEMILVGFSLKDNELVFFNLIDANGKFIFDEEVIFIFILNDVIKAGTKNGEIISIDNIICK